MYGGELIYHTKDKYGVIEVIEQQQAIRSLHFGNKTQQSAMLLANPFVLIHKYAQAMLFPTCFTEPKNVLILGLGAGSLVKHLYNYFTHTNIDAVELRIGVIKVARDYFLLPEPDERFKLFNESAFDWLSNTTATEKYDLIIVDMFLTTGSGNDICIEAETCIQEIYKLLTKNGVATFNHLGGDIYSYSSFHTLSSVFSNNLYTIDIESTNTIIYASRGNALPGYPVEQLNTLEKQFSLPFTNYSKKLVKV